MRGVAVVLAALTAAGSACGRWGFSDAIDAPSIDSTGNAPDGATGKSTTDASSILVDAAPAIDSPPGAGDYAVSQGSAAYVALMGSAVPGFAVGADDENYTLPLPFTFTFYGIGYTSVTVSANGYLTFGPAASGSDTYSNDCPLDTTPPDAMIAVFWDDLESDPMVAPPGYITYATTPSTVAIEWKDFDAFYQAGSGNNAFSQGMRVTHQVVLHDTGVIELLYGPRTAPTRDHDCGLDRHRGCSATVGLEAPASTTFKNVQCGTAAGPGPGYVPIDEGRTITFTPI